MYIKTQYFIGLSYPAPSLYLECNNIFQAEWQGLSVSSGIQPTFYNFHICKFGCRNVLDKFIGTLYSYLYILYCNIFLSFNNKYLLTSH